MKTNLEIEFKTLIDENTYLKMLKLFDLENNVFEQINHYFDTNNADLISNHYVLRIRQKGQNYKLTSKSHSPEGAFEKHIFLTKDQALKMLDEGFDANVIEFPYYVKKVAELTTYRTSTEYKDGRLFFDKNHYYGITDYEIEYEANSMEQGLIDFENFLKENNIPYQKSISKSKRAYKNASF